MLSLKLIVKACVVHNSSVLLLKRPGSKVPEMGELEFPGGRLEPGEDLFSAIRREVKEETGLEVEIVSPLAVHHLVHSHLGQLVITTFHCIANSPTVVLSDEHPGYVWVSLDAIPEACGSFFKNDIVLLKKLGRLQ